VINRILLCLDYRCLLSILVTLEKDWRLISPPKKSKNLNELFSEQNDPKKLGTI